MGISPYPRPGYRIAPLTLREILKIPAPRDLVGVSSNSIKLYDLDETVWNRFAADVCYKLADAVVAQVKASLPLLRGTIKDQHLPLPPGGVELYHLELAARTFNCLKKEGFGQHPTKFSSYTIRELLSIRNFGIRSLVDLLCSLEAVSVGSRVNTDHKSKSDRNLFQKARARSQQRLFTVQNELSFSLEKKAAQEEVIREAKRLRRLWCAKTIRSDDPRLGNLLRAIDLIAADAYEAADRLVTGVRVPFNPIEVAQRLRELYRRIKALCDMPLEEELMSFTFAVRSERNKQIVVRRYGWDGSGGKTLQEVGEEFEITRERVRQVCDRVECSFTGKKPFAPTLDRVLKLITEYTPGTAKDLEAKLALEGLTKGMFRLEGVSKAAELLSLEVLYIIAEVNGKRVTLTPEMEDAAKRITQIARRAIEHWGVTTTNDVAAQATEKHSLLINANTVTYLLEGQEGFQWLDKTGGWFCLTSVPRNRLLNQIEKILSVAERIDVAELRSGVSRHHRMKGVAPPQRVLLELCRQTSWCQVEGKTVSADPLPPWEEVLSDIEQFMVMILKEHGPIMQREKLEEYCLDLGMNRTSFYMYLNYSPVLIKYARGVYGLRGSQVPPGVVEALIPPSRMGQVLIDYGWTHNGKIWVGYKLSKAMVSSGVFTIPAGMKHLANGKFSLKTEDGTLVGTLISEESRSWGLGPLFRRRGGEPGDYLVILFNLGAKEAVAYLGDASLLDDFLTAS